MVRWCCRCSRSSSQQGSWNLWHPDVAAAQAGKISAEGRVNLKEAMMCSIDFTKGALSVKPKRGPSACHKGARDQAILQADSGLLYPVCEAWLSIWGDVCIKL